MRTILAALALSAPSLLSAQDFSHCNALVQHGMNNITTYQSAEHAIAYKYHQNCGSNFNAMSDARVRTAAVSVFGYGSGEASGNSSQMRESLKTWCTKNQTFAESREQLFQEASVLNSSALSAWNQCQEIAKKAVNITFSAQGPHSKWVHFEIDSTLDANLVFLGIEQDGFSCTTRMIDQAGNIQSNPINQRIGNSNVQIDCTRNSPSKTEVDGVGKIVYEAGYIAINTSGPALPVSFEQVVDTYYVTPPGSIVAFNQNFCPQGWQEFTSSSGRMLMGVSEEFALGQAGGRADIPEDGKHTHSASAGTNSSQNWPHPGGTTKAPGGHLHLHNHSVTVNENGPHTHGGDNLPPYIPVKFCRR